MRPAARLGTGRPAGYPPPGWVPAAARS